MKDFFKSYPVKDASRADAVTYVSVLYSLAAVDGVDATESEAIKRLIENNGWESAIFNEAQQNTGITIDSLNLSQEFVEVVGPYLIRDLCAIAHVSNGFSSKEDDYICSISEKIGISPDKYSNIKNAVSSQLAAIDSWSKVVSS